MKQRRKAETRPQITQISQIGQYHPRQRMGLDFNVC